jgi:hypothetical protein
MDNKIKFFSLISIFLFFIFLIYFISHYQSSQDLTKLNNSLNLSLCKNLSGDKLTSCIIKNNICNNNSCYFSKARLSLNRSLCLKINDTSLRVSCLSSITHDLIFQNSVENNNISLCNKLNDNLTIEACKNNYYYVKSINLNNKSYCNYISKEEIKNECLSR